VDTPKVRSKSKQLAHDIFKQLIETKHHPTSVGQRDPTAAEAMAKRLARRRPSRRGDIQVSRAQRTQEKSRGAFFAEPENARPILFIGHLDVVEALRADWSTDPFEFIEKDRLLSTARGTEDMKEGDAILITNFIRLKMEGYSARPRCDFWRLTADEEGRLFQRCGLAAQGASRLG